MWCRMAKKKKLNLGKETKSLDFNSNPLFISYVIFSSKLLALLLDWSKVELTIQASIGFIYCMELFRLRALHIVPNNNTFLFLLEYLFMIFIQGKVGNAILSSSWKHSLTFSKRTCHYCTLASPATSLHRTSLGHGTLRAVGRREEMADTWTKKSWGGVIWVLRWRRCSNLEAQPFAVCSWRRRHSYYMQLNKEAES